MPVCALGAVGALAEAGGLATAGAPLTGDALGAASAPMAADCLAPIGVPAMADALSEIGAPATLEALASVGALATGSGITAVGVLALAGSLVTAGALAIGFILDALLGDPRAIPHPVVGMGKTIGLYEKRIRPLFSPSPRGQFASGAVLATVLPVLAFGVSAGILVLLYSVHFLAGFSVECWMCYQIVSAKELQRQSMQVYRALGDEGIGAARKAVARIVGRDTDSLDEAGVTRAAVETVAENTADGVVAPLVFMAIGGAPLGMAYKAINTMDSMVGYKSERYLHFGRAAARLDDAANYLPARFAALMMVPAASLAGLSAKEAFRIWRRDRRNHASPNSAQTEAACAGALGIRLAGDARYAGAVVEKPTIGDATRPIEPGDIIRANRLMYLTGILALAACCCIRIAAGVAVGVSTGVFAGATEAVSSGVFAGVSTGGLTLFMLVASAAVL